MNKLQFLKEHEHKSEKNFQAESQYIQDNWGWLKYSYVIAIKVRSRMEELGWTQKQLAEVLGCTQQHVSVLLRGRVNMTLETLAKLESALQFDLIGKQLSIPARPYRMQQSTPLYLSSPVPGEEVTTKTSSLVSGYPSRKKKGPKR